MIGFVVAFLAMALGAGALAVVGRKSTNGTLPPNRWAGIRTPYTFSSEDAWYSTHRHAGPVLERSGVIVAVAAVGCLILALVEVFTVALAAVAALVLSTAMVAAALYAWAHGTARARRELGPS